MQDFNQFAGLEIHHGGAKLAWELKYQVWLLIYLAGNDETMLESTKTQLRDIAENIDDICIRTLS